MPFACREFYLRMSGTGWCPPLERPISPMLAYVIRPFECGLQYCIFAFASQLLLYVPAGHIGDIRVFRRSSVSWHMARMPAISSRLPAFALAALGYCRLCFALALAL